MKKLTTKQAGSIAMVLMILTGVLLSYLGYKGEFDVVIGLGIMISCISLLLLLILRREL